MFGEIKIVLDKINTFDTPIENPDFKDVANYPRHLLSTTLNTIIGLNEFRIYILVLKFREWIYYHEVKELFAGDVSRGFCKIGYCGYLMMLIVILDH
jgi:hypothetical protein